MSAESQASAAAAAVNPDGAPTAPQWTVLCVDDEPNILSALKRTLRPEGVRVITADGGTTALEILARESVDVVVSDMRMPEMDGAQLLEQVSQRWPASIRILLTGHADMSATVAAINRGRIFRYMNKPWDDTELRATVRQALELLGLEREKQRLEALTQQQNGLLQEANALLEGRVAERTVDLMLAHDKVKRSYLTSIKVFSGLLELRAGRLAGHGRRVAAMARKMAYALQRPDDEVQHIFVAGLLHDIGLIGVPDELLDKPVVRFTPNESTLFRGHTTIGEQSLMPLEELQPVAALIRAHHERHDGQGWPDGRGGGEIPLGARILAIVDAFDDLQSGHLTDARLTVAEARACVCVGRGVRFDPEIVDVFMQVTEPAPPKPSSDLVMNSTQLEPDMVLARDLQSTAGVLMLSAGQVLNVALIERIHAYERREGRWLDLRIRPRSPRSP
jgi:response regulator RpfG family c-di-GMP phosphodiesterase